MTESFRSAVALRHDFCQSVADLQQRFVAPLPDGATVYVLDLPALYRLVKGLGSAYDALTGLIVVPSAGGNDRWVQQDLWGSSPWSGVEVATDVNSIAAPGAGVWAALGTAAGAFQLSDGDTAAFAVNATSSLLTYHGVPRFVMATAIASVLTSDSENVSIVISKDDDVPAGSSADQFLKGEQMATTLADSGIACITSQRSMFLAPNTTLRLMLRGAGGLVALQVQRFSLSIVQR